MFRELRIAPRAVFERLPELGGRPRFLIPHEGGVREITWSAFAADIRRVALALVELGLRSGDRVAIFAPNRVEWASAALAIQAAGGVMVPIYASSTAEQAAYVVRHSDARFVFVDTPAIRERVRAAWDDYGQVERFISLDEASGERGLTWSQALAMGEASGVDFEALMDSVDLDRPGLMLYTSGTTGNPKGVPLTHTNVAVNGRDWLECYAPLLGEGEVDLLWLPMSHIFGFGELCLGNTLGFTSWLVEPAAALSMLPAVKPTVFMSVPSVWEKLAKLALAEPPERRKSRLDEVTGGRLRFCLSGGAGLGAEVKALFAECGVPIWEGYGLTEASPTLTLNRPGAVRRDTVGRALPSVELRLAEDGEILARGASIFSGYHKDPEATREVLTEDGWLKTGDVGRLTDDGFLRIVDRKKEILVTAGGKNVPPANIEVRFMGDPLIAHVVVYGDAKTYLVAGVWPNPDAARGLLPSEVEARVGAVVERVNATLARYETIKRFAVFHEPLTVEGGLLTPTLKVKRKAVYAAFREPLEALYR